jgi:ABC-type multidrug transport system permease subunit
MRAFWLLTRLRLLDVLRSPSSLGFVMAFPVLLLLVVGFVFADGHPFERRTVILLSCPEEDRRWLTETVASFEEVRLQESDNRAAAEGKLRAREASAIVDLSRGSARPIIMTGPRERLFGKGLASELGGEPSLEVIAGPRFGYVHYLFPGILAFSVMVSGLFATGYTLVLYRQNQFLKKLATTPLRKSTFAFSLVTARSVLVLSQVALLSAVGAVVFEVPFTLAGAGWVAAVTLLGVLAFMGIGFCLACVIKTDDLVVDIVSAVNIPMVFLSEIFFTLDALPRPLSAIGSLLPSTAMVRAVRAALLYQEVSFAAYARDLAVLAVWTVASFAVGLKLFRWHR